MTDKTAQLLDNLVRDGIFDSWQPAEPEHTDDDYLVSATELDDRELDLAIAIAEHVGPRLAERLAQLQAELRRRQS